jgi:hypothetical protein
MLAAPLVKVTVYVTVEPGAKPEPATVFVAVTVAGDITLTEAVC